VARVHLVIGTVSGVYGDGSDGALDGRIVRQVARGNGFVFAASSDGVYRSSDDGRSWDAMGIDVGEVWNVAVSPHDPRVVCAGTQPAHLFMSSDSGSSWTEVESFLRAPDAQRWCLPNSPAGARALALAFDPFEDARFYAGVEVGGAVLSSDRCQSWSVVQPCGNADVHVLMAHPARRGVLFATTGYGRNDDAPMNPRQAGPYRSMDYGVSWEYLGDAMHPHYTRPICIDPRPPYVLTVPAAPDVRSSVNDPGGAATMLFRSDDLGSTWRSLGDPAHAPSPERLTAVTSDPEVAGGVLVGTETGQVWRVTADAEWQLVREGLPSVQSLLAYA
jgi:hypothetical protein